MKKRLVTAALPYVNNIPHLGNLIQVLSADVFARFCRQYGYETLYICGTDEYGTATTTRALVEKTTPRELCDRYNLIHNEIYDWFNIDFDRFGRTSTDKQTEIVQALYHKANEAGCINEKEIEQLYCKTCDTFLADRYVHGTCPHCGYEKARGDQCDDCSKLLDPTDLINPSCGTCGSTPEIRKTKHLFLDLPKSVDKLEEWMKKASVDGFWAKNALRMTESWIRDGLRERCITRDLKWGIPVPREGYEDKVFYVWFDAPIGYVSITAAHTENWKDWWQNPDNVELFQFIGKDNIPFHTVIFPSIQLVSGENWTMLHHMSSSEYLNYENRKFSKSHGVGIFGNDCKDTGIPADVWRFYLYYHRPETSDYNFTWRELQEKVNSELIGNLANLVNRTLTFANRFCDGVIPKGKKDEAFWAEVEAREKSITEKLDRSELREAFKEIFALSSVGNKAFQDGEPWRTRNEAPEEMANLLYNLIYLVRDLSILIRPYLPTTSDTISSFLNWDDFSWNRLGDIAGLDKINKPSLLFKQLEDDAVEAFKERFAGDQDSRDEEADDSLEAQFNNEIDLRTAKIEKVEQHPNADKLYVVEVDCGKDEKRTICSGLVDNYTIEELTGKNVVIVYNLKPAKLRGVKSQGMLLAAETEDEKTLEVLFVDSEPGTKVIVEKQDRPAEIKRVKIDRFFELPITVKANQVYVGDSRLQLNGNSIKTKSVNSGSVG